MNEDERKFVGKVEIPYEITVIAPDPQAKLLMCNWTMREYCGHELTKEAIADDVIDFESSIIKARDDLKVGDRVFMWRNIPLVVVELNDQTATGETDNYIVCLVHGDDDRQCWVAGAWINKYAISRMEIAMNPDASGD